MPLTPVWLATFVWVAQTLLALQWEADQFALSALATHTTVDLAQAGPSVDISSAPYGDQLPKLVAFFPNHDPPSSRQVP